MSKPRKSQTPEQTPEGYVASGSSPPPFKPTPKPIEGMPRMTDSQRQSLRESIEKHGVLEQLHFCVNGTILDGHERWAVTQELGIKNFTYKVYSAMTEDQRIALAIDLNSQRKTITLEQRQKLLEMYVKAAPHKSSREVAEAVGVHHSTAARVKRRVAPATPTVGRDGKVYPRPASTAAHTIQGARKAAKDLARLPAGAIQGSATGRKINKANFEHAKSEMANDVPVFTRDDYRLIHGDFEKEAASLEDSILDLGLGDPPWAWNRDELKAYMETYFRLLKPGGLAAIYCGIHQIGEMSIAADLAGLKHWSAASCKNQKPHRGVAKDGMINSSWRIVMIFVKPGGETPKALNWLTNWIDVLEVPSETGVKPHEWAQPLEESKLLLKGLGRPGWLVGDLTIGSATSGVACVEFGARYIGYEIKEVNYRIASKRIADALNAKKKQAG
jgi:SAM-dependent methyltransferase